MGTVYLAEHPLIGKKVALKVIHPELSTNREVISRFFNEARAVNKIGSEHIVEIHDFGQTDAGEHFFIMEYLQGVTLAHVLGAERVLPAERALHIGAQVANGLAAAHACGIIHRDLKPDNIMLLGRLGDRDFVKVLDFGLAKMIADAAGPKLTAAGVVLGTPQYMSPEACESRQDIDHRSDIYCLGILLFQMLTGRVPFEGETMGEILVKHVSQPPPAPRALNANIPPSVEQIVLRCLAKDRDDRFPTMKDLRDALLDADRYLASSPPVVPSSGVALSPDAKTMFQVGESEQAIGSADTMAQDRPKTDPRFALKPPPPSMVNVDPNAAPASPDAKTAFMEAPAQVAGAGETGGGAASPEAKTAFMTPGVAPGGAPGGEAAIAAAVAASRTRSAVPEMNPPLPPANKTMVIGTPEGYSDKPPRKVWPVVVAVASVLVVVGGGFAALVWPGFLQGDKGGTASASTSPAGAGEEGETDAGAPSGAVSPKDAASEQAAVGSGDAGAGGAQPQVPVEPKLAELQIETVPSGAEVLDGDGKLLGKTPVKLTFPSDGAKHELVFRHPDAKERHKTVEVTGDAEINVELEMIDKPTRPAHGTGKKHTGKKHTGKKHTGKKPDKPPEVMGPSFD